MKRRIVKKRAHAFRRNAIHERNAACVTLVFFAVRSFTVFADGLHEAENAEPIDNLDLITLELGPTKASMIFIGEPHFNEKRTLLGGENKRCHGSHR
jgi:hypothetical protein